jgi:hypothetical protein
MLPSWHDLAFYISDLNVGSASDMFSEIVLKQESV